MHLVVGAAMCPAFDAALSSPLAIMPFADRLPDHLLALEVRGRCRVV